MIKRILDHTGIEKLFRLLQGKCPDFGTPETEYGYNGFTRCENPSCSSYFRYNK